MLSSNNLLIHYQIKLFSQFNRWIKISLKKAKYNSIERKELTPFLIKEINSLSKNKTLKANIGLIINNALLAGKLAKIIYLIK